MPLSIFVNSLPRMPGVYLFKNRRGEVIYVGKAANLRERVRSYFAVKGRPLDLARGDRMGRPIEDMAHEIASVKTAKTPTVIEALILEAALIKKHWPRYNVREKDQKSFLYVVITKEKYPMVELMREEELGRSSPVILSKRARPRSFDFAQDDSWRARAPKDLPLTTILGPFPHASAIRAALRIIRRIFPYSTCRPPGETKERKNLRTEEPNHKRTEAQNGSSVSRFMRSSVSPRPCFNYHIGLCPGVCIGAVTPREYKKTIRNIILFFEGKKAQVIRELKRDMTRMSRAELFEDAAKLRNQIRSLEHIRDVAVITDDAERRGGLRKIDGIIDVFSRLEGYDMSNIGGKHAVGSMVVFENGEPRKSEYRLFKIKTVKGANDAAMMKEVLRRRLKHSIMSSRPTPPFAKGGGVERYPLGAAVGRSLDMARDDKKRWPLPQLILVDGGIPQVNAARSVVHALKLNIPLVGIAKGPNRKRDEFVITGDVAVKEELERITRLYPHILKHLRDEAHRFAQNYYRRRHRRAVAHR